MSETRGRLLIAGTGSGCGKTTVTLAVLSALRKRGLTLSAFKCGPDYIDPMFHRRALGLSSENLDPYFSTPDQLRRQLAGAGGLAILEGVMGYYDGIGVCGEASTYHVAAQTGTPVVLVVNAKGMYTSVGAVLQGFCAFRPQNHIRGVIFNGVSGMVYSGLAQIARAAGVMPLGYLPRIPESALDSRHLGLVTAQELPDIQAKLDRLGRAAEESLDLEALLTLAAQAEPLTETENAPAQPVRVRLAVARDEAFCFVYEETLALLRRLGCALCFFSPLRDAALPPDIGGLYLPGGYPELHGAALAQNAPLLRAVRQAVEGGLPTVAECGGFLYLHETLEGYPMVGVIRARACRTERLQRFGYAALTTQTDSLLGPRGTTLRAHEFHYCDSTDNGTDCLAEKPSGAKSYRCGHLTETLYAGFPHLYLPAYPEVARRFVEKAVRS